MGDVLGARSGVPRDVVLKAVADARDQPLLGDLDGGRVRPRTLLDREATSRESKMQEGARRCW